MADKISYSSRTSNQNDRSYGSSPRSNQPVDYGNKYSFGDTYQESTAAYDYTSYPKYTSATAKISSGSDYTNPDLLKSLNIGPFPKRSNDLPDYSSYNSYASDGGSYAVNKKSYGTTEYQKY